MREQDGDAERAGFSQTLPAQTCFRQTEHFTRTGFLLYSSQPFGLKSAGWEALEKYQAFSNLK